MVTVRPLDEQGRWQYKTEKEYLCARNGEERGFTAAEFKAAQADGWEKQYLYKAGKKKIYLPPSEAKAHGYERASKHPKSTKFGRQNPITERWNSEEQLVLWRKAWGNMSNRYLEQYGHDARIDYRAIAEAMESVRQKALVFCYQLGHIRRGKYNVQQYPEAAKPELERYTGLVGEIKEKSKERKSLLADKKNTSVWNVPKIRKLAARIAELTEQIEELQSEKNTILQYLSYDYDREQTGGFLYAERVRGGTFHTGRHPEDGD